MLFQPVPTAETCARSRPTLTRQSYARRVVRPRLQLTLAGDGVRHRDVILGRDGWLFYRPGIDWMIGPGLLDPARLRLRRKELVAAGEADPAPDPRPAILRLPRRLPQGRGSSRRPAGAGQSDLQAAELTSRFEREGPASHRRTRTTGGSWTSCGRPASTSLIRRRSRYIPGEQAVLAAGHALDAGMD